MTHEEQVRKMTDMMAKFIGHTGKKLPDDVIAKLEELRSKEDSPMAKVIYDTMFRNQELAVKLNRPSCQDTGVLQFWVKCGTRFPLIDDLEALLKEAVVKATFETPLRHNSVETFVNTTPAKMWARERRLSGGILYRIPMNARSIPIWPAAAARFREMQRY